MRSATSTKSMATKIPLYKVRMHPSVGERVSQTLYSGYVGEGERVREFEEAFSDWLRIQDLSQERNVPGPLQNRVVATNSCTSALHLAFHIIKSEDPNGEVLASPLTCFAGIAAILANGLRIRWVDVDLETGCMDPEDLARKISPTTRSLLVTDFCGIPSDMEAIAKVIRWKKVVVVEDCAHALGSSRNGIPVGFGYDWEIAPRHVIKCFSFQATKPLTAGDGGALVSWFSPAHKAKLLRWYGIDRSKERYSQSISDPGYKFHMNDISASVALGNMTDLDDVLDTQEEIRTQIKESCPEVRVLWPREGDTCKCSVLPIRVANPRKFEAKMREVGVMAETPHALCHKHSCVERFWEHLPNVESLASELTAVPAGWWVKDSVEQVIGAIKVSL